MPSSPSTPPRAYCYRCHKAATTCVCASVRTVDNRTEILVVQHPREQRHPIGSLRFARLGLSRCRIGVAERDETGGLAADLQFPAGAALLYPGDGAPVLEDLRPDERPSALVVLDGTWSTVRALLRGDPRLAAMPRVCLRPQSPSRYRIRREPRAECLSTLEALIAALRVLEPEKQHAWNDLSDAFSLMIDRQIDIAKRRTAERLVQPPP